MYKNSNSLLKLITGLRTGLNNIFLNTFKHSLKRIGITTGFNYQIEISVKYLYPLLFFCKNHSLCLFNLLMDLTCFEFLGSKYRFVLIYNLLNINNGLRLVIKCKITELNNTLLSSTSLFYTSN